MEDAYVDLTGGDAGAPGDGNVNEHASLSQAPPTVALRMEEEETTQDLLCDMALLAPADIVPSDLPPLDDPTVDTILVRTILSSACLYCLNKLNQGSCHYWRRVFPVFFSTRTPRKNTIISTSEIQIKEHTLS
jgi:hypothetical protein